MKLEVFELIITTLEKQSKKSFDVAELGIDLLNYEDGWVGAINLLLCVYYGMDAAKWIEWYLYDRNADSKEAQAWDENKNPICFDIPSLWKHVESMRVSESFVEFELPQKTVVTENDLRNFFRGLEPLV